MTAPKPKKRLDLLLLERGFVESRAKAQALILAGQVSVLLTDGTLRPPATLKPGDTFPESAQTLIQALPKYVSRGGDKLSPMLERWHLSVQDRDCLDVGSSTGGFTDCLLQAGARSVTAVDVGYGQMHPKLRSDPRVKLFEETHILKWTAPWIDKSSDSDYKLGAPTLAVIDVSFISLEKVLARTGELLPEGAEVLALVKPQFEVGPKHLKKGIVKSEEAKEASILKIMASAKATGLTCIDRAPCPLPGAKGNQEEWLYIRKGR